MYLRSPWHRARLALGGKDANDLTREDIFRLVVPDARAEQLDVERALASLSPTARAVRV